MPALVAGEIGQYADERIQWEIIFFFYFKDFLKFKHAADFQITAQNEIQGKIGMQIISILHT